VAGGDGLEDEVGADEAGASGDEKGLRQGAGTPGEVRLG
jgi:hypothetical protein